MNLRVISLCAIPLLISLTAFSQERVRSLRPKYTSEMTVIGYTGGETLTNFPVAVRISTSNIEGFNYNQCKGQSDVVFSDANGMTLPHEIECWNTNGESVAWVSLPTMTTNSPTTFTMNWKLGAEPDSCSTSVWTNPKYLGVWHMNTPYDATLSANYQTNSAGNFDLPLTQDSKISLADNGMVGNTIVAKLGEADAIALFTTPHLPNSNLNTTGFVLSGWSYWKGNTANNAREVFIVNPSAGSYKWQLYISSKKLYSRFATSGQQLGTNYVHKGWFHWSVRVSNKSKWDYYINGAWQQTRTTTQVKYINYMTTLKYSIGGTEGYTDEIRIHNIAASDDWIKAEYDSMKNAEFVTAAPAVRRPDPLQFIIR